MFIFKSHEGVTVEQKEEVIKGVTDFLVRVLKIAETRLIAAALRAGGAITHGTHSMKGT